MEHVPLNADDRPSSVALCVARAHELTARGERAAALTELSAAIVFAQQEAFASMARLAQALRNPQGRMDDELARQTATQQQVLFDLHLERGQCYLALGQSAQAIADFNSVLQLDPTHARAYSHRGEAYFQTGDNGRAVADYREALKLSSGGMFAPSAEPIASEASETRGQGSPPQAVPVDPEPRNETQTIPLAAEASMLTPAMLVRVDDSTSPPEVEVIPLLAEPSPSASTMLATSDEPSAPGGPEDGLTMDSEETAAANPATSEEVTPVSPADLEASRAFYRQGEVARNNGDHEAAVSAYTAALHHDPGYRLAYLNRGQSFRAQKAYEAALADFTELLRLDANHAEAHFRRGNVRADRQDHEGALGDYSAALAIDPGLVAAHVNRGLVHAKVGDSAAALADADAAIQLDPGYASAYFLRGSAHARLEHLDDAVTDFDRLVALEPRNALAYNERGLVQVRLGRHDQAVADYTMALRLRPRFAHALYNRGVAHRLRGDHAQAIEDLSLILRSKPDHVPALQQRGLAYLAAEQYDEAVADFLAAVQIEPEFREGYQLSLQALQAKAASPPPAQPATKQTVLASPAPTTNNGFRPRRKTALARPLAEEPPASVEAEALAPSAPAPSEKAEYDEEPEPSYEEIASAEAPAGEAPDLAHSVAAIAAQSEEQVDLAAPATEDPGATMLQNAGKLKLECPDCEMSGLFDFNQLNKLIRCRNCNNFYRVDALGELVRIPPEKLPTGIMVEVRSGLGGWKRRWVPAPGAKITDLALPQVAVSPEPPAPARPKPTSARTKKGPSRLEQFHAWSTQLRETHGRWILVSLVVAVLALAGIAATRNVVPIDLREGSDSVAHAWINQDVATMEKYVDP
ncbi:MAG: tetratricopeptide repeat protein, partial [Gemmataceae bacterium]